MKLTEVYRHCIKIEYNDGIRKLTDTYEYFSTEFMNSDEFQATLKEIERDIDCPKFKVIQFLAEREVL